MLWGSGAIFLRLFRFAPRKIISRWKSLCVFQRLMFLYQLVNLVLETCLIFSKTLKLSKTYLSWISRQVRSVKQRALWYPYSRLFFGIVFKRVLFLEYFYKVNCGVNIGFSDTSLFFFRKMFEWMTCKMKIMTSGSQVSCCESA